MEKKTFRAPAVPLIAHDPMFSIWSFEDKLTDGPTRHWDGIRKHMFGLLAVDGILYEFMSDVALQEYYHPGYRKMEQTGCEIRPMSTVYSFENEVIRLELTFTSPLLLNDLDILSRPISYITSRITPKDDKEHKIHLHFGFTGEFCVDHNDQSVFVGRTPHSLYFSSGTERMLQRSGDGHRIEWGEFHVIAPDCRARVCALRHFNEYLKANYADLKYFKNTVVTSRDLGPAAYEMYEKAVVFPHYPTIAIKKELVLEGKPVEHHFAVGYNDFKSVQYFGENISAYWARNGLSFGDITVKALREYREVMEKVAAFEEMLLARARKISDKYADILSLAYRQTIAAHKLTWHDGELQFFSKENYSNGCMATVDVTYPSIPLFLLYAPELVEGMLNPVFKLVEKGLWDYPFAPHDVGTYPLANGQAYGFTLMYARETDPLIKQMPVEECGNMILCVAAACYAKKDLGYFEKHRKILTQWADYLAAVGYDPEHQLCTDDFAGHLAHNCNLSLKAICALGAFGKMLRDTGREDRYSTLAAEMAQRWEREALDGDHYRLAFDQAGTWSMKYNLVWDRLLGLDLFSEEVTAKELAYYKTRCNAYGLPLDSRSDYTKSDWQMWVTALTDDEEFTDLIVSRMWDFLRESPDRVPFCDWYFTTYPKIRGFQARSVQGGLFIKLLGEALLSR
jgi:hypothetical protein